MLLIGTQVKVDNVSGVDHLSDIVGKTATIVGIDHDVSAWEFGYKVNIEGDEYMLYPWEIETDEETQDKANDERGYL